MGILIYMRENEFIVIEKGHFEEVCVYCSMSLHANNTDFGLKNYIYRDVLVYIHQKVDPTHSEGQGHGLK